MSIDRRVQAVAATLYLQAYEAEYGGKTRGKFQISREDVMQLIGVPRLHPEHVQKLTDACLATNLAVVDMDATFVFLETNFVSKFRKLPSRLVLEYVDELERGVVVENADDVYDLEADED